MKTKLIIIAILGLLASTYTMAWDEVTHSFMTDKIIQEIRIPELQQLLEQNKNEFLSGSWYTDTYQYTPNRHETLNPHNLDVHCNAYVNYLQKEEVKKQDNYEQLVALLLGSLAHTTEDFWLDNILYKYPQTIGEDITGDTYNGVISLHKFHYLKKKVKPYFPANDLLTMYKDAGLLEQSYDTPRKFDKLYKQLITKQYEQLRLLKLLSFLASNQVQNRSPWMSANILTVTGGMLSCVNNSSRYLEAVWEVLNNQPTQGILNAEYSPLDNRLGLLVSFPLSVMNEDQLDLVVLNDEQDTIPGSVSAFSFGGTRTNLVTLVYKFDNDSVFKRGNYTVTTKAKGENTINYSAPFIASTKGMVTDYPQKPKTLLETIGAGLYLFMLCLGLAGVFWGLSAIYPFIWATKKKKGSLPMFAVLLQKGLQLVGIVIFVFGIYLLFTKGWLVVMNV